MNFIRNHWFDLGGFLALAVLLFLAFRWPSLTDYQLLMWMNLVSLLAYQLEAYRAVGTFPGMVNRVMYNSSRPDRYPLNAHTDFCINVGIFWAIYTLAAFWGEQMVWLGLAAILISLVNTLAHTILFNLKGKTVYNAGMATSWFLFVPIITSFFTLVLTQHLATTADYVIGSWLGILLGVVGRLRLIDWLKDQHTPYAFPPRCLLAEDQPPYSSQPKNKRTMKSIFLLCGLLTSLSTISCQKSEQTNQKTPSQTAESATIADAIVRDTVTDKDGVQLAMTFDNTRQTARFVLQGETIDLQQDPTGSGIKYSNAEYEFTEHQGQMTLKKNGKLMFSHRK